MSNGVAPRASSPVAHFLLICDPDAERRRKAALHAAERVAFLPRLRAGIALATDYAAVWAAAPDAPVELRRGRADDTPDCLLFGEPHDADGNSFDAAEFAGRSARAWSSLHALNGYYAAILIDPRHGVRAEADALGIFPLYYWHGAGVLLIGTSAALFRSHPLFPARLDLHGVAALLLTSGIVAGRTLAQGVRRLGADCRLFCPPGGEPREAAPDCPDREPPLESLDEAVNLAASLHQNFLRRGLRQARRPGLLLSGGLDSRLLAGISHDLGQNPACLTFGRPSDLDARCALGVARELDFFQVLADIMPADYEPQAETSVRWEQLSGGLYALPIGWNLALRPPAIAVDRVICGLTLDAVIGGAKHVAPSDPAPTFEQLRVGRLGFGREALSQLVAAPELAAACDDLRQQLVHDYIASEGSDPLREWRMNLAHRHRFAVGACAWRYSLFAWPVMPALDRQLIALARRLPHALAKNRQVQTQMLISRFPPLARLELDRNYFDTTPLVGTPDSLAFDLGRRAVRWQRRAQAWLGRDPRFYVRTMNFNHAGWRKVRAAADSARRSAGALLHRDALDRLLPRASVSLRSPGDPIIQSAPLKNLIGLLLWLRQPA